MKISELVSQLQDTMQKEGDLRVVNRIYPQCKVEINIKNMRIRKDKRQKEIEFWNEYGDHPSQKGETVIAI